MSSSPAHDIGGTDTDSPNSSVHSFYVTELSDTESAVFVGNGSLVDKASAAHHGRVAIEDWSQTGRGVHIDFDDRETVPLTQGQFLGRGATGDVHETIVQGWRLAHKKIYFTRRVQEKEKREVLILTKLTHVHITQLIGTYTQKKVLGVLMYPVAVCDLHTFFEDIEAWTSIAPTGDSNAELDSLDPIHRSRLEHLGYNFPVKMEQHKATLVYSKIGCLVSAVAYLHDQNIRHKDLKPSNVLLSRYNIWLSDFGSATDFTLLSQSATNNERGTPRYFAPEVAEWKPSGRAADRFSLGCVLVEILCLHRRGSLDHLRRHRSLDPSFHVNIDQLDTWLENDDDKFTRGEYYLEQEIRLMLSRDPVRRPTAPQLLSSITVHDITKDTKSTLSVFGHCCKGDLIPSAVHAAAIAELRVKASKSTEQIQQKYISLYKDLKGWRKAHEKLARYSSAQEKVLEDAQVENDKLREQSKTHVQYSSIQMEALAASRAEVEMLRKSHSNLSQFSDAQQNVLAASRVEVDKLRTELDALASRRLSVSPTNTSKTNAFARDTVLQNLRYDQATPWSSHYPHPHPDEFTPLNITRRSPMPNDLKAEFVPGSPRPYGEDGSSNYSEKPAKPSLRNRIASGLGLKRLGAKDHNVDGWDTKPSAYNVGGNMETHYPTSRTSRNSLR